MEKTPRYGKAKGKAIYTNTSELKPRTPEPVPTPNNLETHPVRK